jgi:hypothetical protein
MVEEFQPTLYLMKACPFCFKLRVFLLDAELLYRFHIREFAVDTDNAKRVHNELAPHFDKVSFPAAQIAPGEYEKDSDCLIALFARQHGTDPANLKTFQAYVDGPFTTLMSLFKENRELKQQAA